MSDFMEILKTRRTVRKFEDKEVEEEKLNQVLEAIQWTQFLHQETKKIRFHNHIIPRLF